MKTILYQRDIDKILVNELQINEQNFINYNEKVVTNLFKDDYLKNTTSELIYNIDKEYYGEKNKYNLEKYHKIYSNSSCFKEGDVTYLIPKINKKSTSIYNKFSNQFSYNEIFENFNKILVKLQLNKLPNYEDIKDYYKNYEFKDELFYFPLSDLALKLNDELKLLYKLLYIKKFNIDKKEIINKDEFKKIFTLNFKEVISYDTYFDIISKYKTDINDHFIQTINNDINIDEEKIKKIKLILK